ncbi:30S ribosomal protein S14 [Candidatus Shikimatogenerans bostrichidophilus]|uniref:30S ribosomal protein S14 n=1 Tax=Candidatus Shikimatogenerans bostrichidophilus TaxID=2943807 RepID=UPI002966B434
MAKESLKSRQKKKNKLFIKYYKKNKYLKNNKKFLELQKIPRNASIVRQKNICKITGRTRGYIRFFGISRIEFRRLSSNGLIPGIKKSSW